MIATIYLFIVLLSLVILHLVSRNSQSAKLIDKIPGPTPLPFVGNGLMFNDSPENLWQLFIQLIDDYYPIVRAWIFNIKVVFISHPDDMRKLLSCKNNIGKCKRLVYNGFQSIDSDGLILSGGDKWRQRRKMITPAFVPSMLKVYVQIINAHSERLIMDIKQKTPETELDLLSTLKKFTLGVICEAAMGVDPNSSGAKKAEGLKCGFNAACDMVFYRAMRPYIRDWMVKFLSVGRKLERALPVFRNLIETIINERREYLKGYPKLQNIVDETDDVETHTNEKKRLAIIDLLLNAEAEGLIDDRGISEELETFMAAGYDTSGVSITFALMLLAENADAQDLARAEVTQMFERTGGKLEMADVNSLDYLNRCIRESLRLYSSAPLIGRHITKEIELSNYKIPQGTEVLMHFFHLHRDPNYWPDPEKFDPDRFLPENTEKRHPFAYLPFSSGPRNCIGKKFALLEMKIIVAHILYNFHIVPADPLDSVKFEVNITLMPITPCRVKLICIDQKSNVRQV